MAQLDKVVDFAIEDNAQRATGIVHRLMTGRGQVNNRQATLA
jgi:hypothetical protein